MTKLNRIILRDIIIQNVISFDRGFGVLGFWGFGTECV